MTDKLPNPFIQMATTVGTAGTGSAFQSDIDAGLNNLPEYELGEAFGNPQPDIYDLALLDTDTIKPINTFSDRVQVVGDAYIVKDGAAFRAVADELDRRMSSDERLESMELAQVRNYVRTLMASLARDKDLATVMMPKDVRNCLIYAKLVYDESNMIDAAAVQKKAAKAPAKSKKGKANAAFAAAFIASFEGL